MRLQLTFDVRVEGPDKDFPEGVQALYESLSAFIPHALVAGLRNVKTWRRVTGWVGGPKRNGFTLQSKPDAYACDDCIQKMQAGHAPDEQPMEFES